MVYKDSLIEGNFTPVAPGGSGKPTVGGGKVQVVDAKVQAAVFDYQVHQLFVEPTPDVKAANLAALAIRDQVSCIRIAYGPVLHNLPKSASVQHSVEVFTSQYSQQKT